MSRAKKPSHPLSKTFIERRDRAFATAKPPSVSRDPIKDREAYSRGEPSKVLALLDDSILSAIIRDKEHLAPDAIEERVLREKIISAFEEIEEGVERVRHAREISERARRPARHKAGVSVTNNETLERAIQAHDGIAKEKLSGNDGHHRARIRSPMALSEEVTFREREQLAAIKEANLPADKRPLHEPKLRGSRFDAALEHGEDGPILRMALSRYIVDHLTASRHDGSRNASGGASDPSNRLALTEEQQKALDRIDFVHGRLFRKDRKDLDQFRQMVIAPDANLESMSMADYGRQKTGHQQKDDRFPEGVFVGRMQKIGERLHDIYRLRELPAHLARRLFGE